MSGRLTYFADTEDCSISSALAMEILQSCTNPSMCWSIKETSSIKYTYTFIRYSSKILRTCTSFHTITAWIKKTFTKQCKSRDDSQLRILIVHGTHLYKFIDCQHNNLFKTKTAQTHKHELHDLCSVTDNSFSFISNTFAFFFLLYSKNQNGRFIKTCSLHRDFKKLGKFS